MFNAENRQEHNKLAYEYVLKRKDKFLSKLSKDKLYMLAYAALEHRASFNGKFYSKLSEIISSADRGLPNLESIVIRSMKFHKGHIDDVYNHMLEKYGVNGYATYPISYRMFFKEELTLFQKSIDKLTYRKILEIGAKR